MPQTQIPGKQILDGSVTEVDLSFSDNTTNNATISKHGLMPKLPNDTTKYINGAGNWIVCYNASEIDTKIGDIESLLGGI